MSNRRPPKRALVQVDDDDEEDKFYKLKILLPNGTNVTLTLNNPQPEMSIRNFVNLVKEEYEKTRKSCVLSGKMRKRIDWNLAAESYLDFNGEKIIGMVRLETFKPDSCNILRLDDGSGEATTMYENMWDLTPDTDMLKELPENYSFETALADLIDNSLQAVWSCSPVWMFSKIGFQSLILVLEWTVARKTLLLSGPPNPKLLEANHHTLCHSLGCLDMEVHTRVCIWEVSSKTKQSKKVFTLQLNKEALIDNRSTSGKNWKVDGGMRDPLDEEMKLSPHGSFTKVEIFEWKCKIPEIYQLQCRLKDIYFPYIQYDEVSKTGRTLRPVEFQVHGEDLTEIVGGEVATTNLNSKGEEFWFQIRICEKRKGTSQEANARLKFVYFPIVHGKESTDIIMESLEKEGYKVSESFQTFGRVSVRRLGRLLPEVPWASIPFMERGARASTLQKCCQRVKCFVDLDAGFVPTPSKTDLSSQNLFSVALKNFGNKSKEKDNDVSMVIHREGTSLTYGQVEQSYHDWVLKMHKSYDEEDAMGEDEATVIFDSLDKKALCISHDCEAVRVHKVMKRKGKSWERGQKIKIMKGACGGVHKNDVYATIDYFLIENFEDETGAGDARIICRQINFCEEEGCMLSTIKGISKLEIRKSSSFPISIIDTEKCVLIDDNEWNRKLVKQKEKDPSRIDLLDEKDCRTLKFNGETTIGASVCAGQTLPQQIVAVVRPASYTSSKLSKKLDQKHFVKMDREMLMEVELQGTQMKSREKNAKPLYSDRCFPTNRGGLHGLYIFQLESKIPHLFKKAGTYIFSFSVGNSVTCKKKVIVKPSSKVGSWKLGGNQETINVRVGSSLPPLSIYCLDEYENQIPFTSVPSLEVRLKASPEFEVPVYMIEANLTDSGILKLKDEPFSVSVACIVKPGPLKCVVEKDAQALENLLPDSTVENFILEVFDEYNNHVAEGTNVPICTSGLFIQDRMCLDLKVDSDGCIDLSGILKVTAGYGKPVSLSIMSGKEEIFKRESLVEIRELRLLTELPEYCTAGTNLTNLKFKVTDSYGIMDTSINNDDKSECFHTLSIESDSCSVDSTTRYAFVHGSCKITSLSLPETEGAFSFKVFHSRHPELHMNLKIQLTPAQTFERDEIGCYEPNPRIYLTPLSKMGSTTNPLVVPTQQTPSSEFLTQQTPPSQFRVLSIRDMSSAINSQTDPVDMAQFSEYTEILKAKLNSYTERISEANECLKCLEAEQEEAVQELSALQASLEPHGVSFPECLSNKESMMKHIEENHHNTAASVFYSLYRNAPASKSMLLSKEGVFGIVALLGSVASTPLSRVLSEYLGEDTTLALVCKSSRLGPNIDPMLQAEAARLERSITSRFHVLCLGATRCSPWTGGIVENDPQRKLAMDDPKLPDGDPIPGFIGYAVNMINLAEEELNIKTYEGHGLRETLFYDVFGKLQVYETQTQAKEALEHISGDGAVSLDGFIAKGNKFICSRKPEIHFPITVRENEEEKWSNLEEARNRVRRVEKKIVKARCLLSKLEKKMNKANERSDSATKLSLES
ncbi:hypothetical protein Bca101_078349 [Brassica carinata]